MLLLPVFHATHIPSSSPTQLAFASTAAQTSHRVERKLCALRPACDSLNLGKENTFGGKCSDVQVQFWQTALRCSSCLLFLSLLLSSCSIVRVVLHRARQSSVLTSNVLLHHHCHNFLLLLLLLLLLRVLLRVLLCVLLLLRVLLLHVLLHLAGAKSAGKPDADVRSHATSACAMRGADRGRAAGRRGSEHSRSESLCVCKRCFCAMSGGET
eukprot:3295701-Rhodomonas_salina.1